MTARKRPIPSLHGEYLAGEDGTIWRRGRYERKAGRFRPATKLKPGFQGSHGGLGRRGRYLKVNVTVNGVQAQRAVHRLVAEAWLPGWHPLYEVHHANGDPTDNRAANLRLMNKADHERLHGRDVPEYDRVNCQVDLERRMAEYEPRDPFTDARRAAARARKARHDAVMGSAQSRQIAQIARRATTLSREMGAMRRKLESEGKI